MSGATPRFTMLGVEGVACEGDACLVPGLAAGETGADEE